jgi:uncharacterized protein YeaO (DUF488 family)
MPIRVVRLGTERARGEGLRIGTVRRPPRGVAKADYAVRNYFDVWLPELAPTAELVAAAQSRPWTPARWQSFARRYRRQLQAPGPRRLIELLAALSATTDFAVGCYCEDASRCHRSILGAVLADAGARMVATR